MPASKKPLFDGCASALITPFTKEGSLDEDALKTLIARQKGMDALVVLGTTGEPCSLSMQERERIIDVALTHSECSIIVGTGSNDTRKAIEYAHQAEKLGAHGQLAVTPYYNKTSQTGLIRHYRAIMDSSALPLLLYNVPSRTGLNMSAETVAELSCHPNCAGIKDASGDLTLTADVIAATNGNFPVYCGNDDLILPMMAMGAVGAISVAANLLPLQIRAITKACTSGCLAQAQAAHSAMLPLIRALQTQVNPIPIKAALNMLKLCEDSLRLPLTPLDYPDRSLLENTLKALGLIL